MVKGAESKSLHMVHCRGGFPTKGRLPNKRVLAPTKGKQDGMEGSGEPPGPLQQQGLKEPGNQPGGGIVPGAGGRDVFDEENTQCEPKGRGIAKEPIPCVKSWGTVADPKVRGQKMTGQVRGGN